MSKPIATNRKAYRDFAFTETWECGIALNGGEVKSIRQGGVNFKDSYARVEKKEIFLHNLHIDPYAHAGIQSLDPVRKRKLLLHKREIRKLIEERKSARLVKDWRRADEVRQELATKGVLLKDNSDGSTSWEIKAR